MPNFLKRCTVRRSSQEDSDMRQWQGHRAIRYDSCRPAHTQPHISLAYNLHTHHTNYTVTVLNTVAVLPCLARRPYLPFFKHYK